MHVHVCTFYAHFHTQFVLLRVENQKLLTTLVRFASSLRLDQVDQIVEMVVSYHVPWSAILMTLLQMQSGSGLMGMLSPQHHQDSHKLLVMCYTS